MRTTRWPSPSTAPEFTHLPGHYPLTCFTARREELLRLLTRLDPADWERESVHTAYGPFTLAQYAAHLAAHEEEHLPQLLAALEVAAGAG